jgi:cysteine-rich repeat protein
VVADGNEVLVASSYGASAVYRFDASGTLLQTYADPTPLGSDEFGAAVAVAGAHVVVGPGSEGAGNVAYLFDAATGALEHTFTPPFVSDSLLFGLSVGGANGAASVGSNDGVFVYDVDPPYDLLQELHAPTPFTDDRDGFGRALASLDDGLVVGAGSAVYLFDPCGNGVATAREQCDDGNLTDGDGCSALCLLETCGMAPAAGCTAAAKSKLSLQDEHSIFGIKDAIKWAWSGPAVDLTTFGDPLSATALVLCLYDRTETVTPRLRMQPAALPAGSCAGEPCWTALGSGVAYDDAELSPSGIARLTLKTGATATKVKLLGKGPDLGVPVDAPGSIDLDGQVTVQLRSSTTSACLTVDLPLPALVDGNGRYKDRTD